MWQTSNRTNRKLAVASLVARAVKNLPALWDLGWSLGWEGPLEKGMTTHSSILTWRIPSTEEPGGLQSMGLQKRHDWATNNTSLQRHNHSKWGKCLFIQGCSRLWTLIKCERYYYFLIYTNVGEVDTHSCLCESTNQVPTIHSSSKMAEREAES